MSEETAPALTKSDFDPGTDVRWCPGCGDYSILANMQRFLPTLGVRPENHVFVSGIGCSSRFPYYMNTYGFHTLHGRAPAFATGVKLGNPDLHVWIVTGDGDGLGIGGNHLLHLFRRNPNIVVMMFNNRIYGLTKGQTSPTSGIGIKTKSTPYGSTQVPLNPLEVALSARASFVARTIDSDAAGMGQVLKAAAAHEGTSFIEIFQTCRVFNDDAFTFITDRQQRDTTQLKVENGKPLLFGKNGEKGIRIRDGRPEVVDVDPSDPTGASVGVVVFDSTNIHLSRIIANLEYPAFPSPTGVVFQSPRETLDQGYRSFAADVTLPLDTYVEKLFHSGDVWVEKGE